MNEERPHQKGKGGEYSDEDGDDVNKSVLNQAIDDTRHVLAGSEAPPEVDGKYKKLFDMSFMKRARDSQQEKAMDEAKALLHEIAEMEAGDSDDEQAPKSKKKSVEELKALEEAKVQVKDMLGGVFKGGKGALTSTAKSVAVNNPWLDENAKTKRTVTKSNKRSAEPVLTVVEEEVEAAVEVSVPAKKSKVVYSAGGAATATAKTVVLAPQDTTEPSRKKQKSEKAITSVEPVDANATAKKQLVAKKTQEELVHMAFAGPDYEADFAQTKQRMVDDELNIDEKKIKALAQGKVSCSIICNDLISEIWLG